jgi:hypothetical protein
MQGIGFNYEEQYQEALDKQYPVSSGVDRARASATGTRQGDNLGDHFRKATQDPSLQPGYADMTAVDRIKARIKHAVSAKAKALGQSGVFASVQQLLRLAQVPVCRDSITQ